MSVRIIVDSTADLLTEDQEKVTVIPMIIQFGEEEFLDGVTLTHHQFYEKLIESDNLPTTSQIPPYTFEEYFKEAVEAGDQVVCMTLSSALSGTFQSATIAAKEYPEQVWVVDSQSVAIGLGILTRVALQLKEEGRSAKEIADILTEERSRIRVVAMLDTLEYLKKGGRISATVAFAGGLLAIKPVISLQGGNIEILGKARGSRQGNNLLVSEINKAGGVDFNKPFLLGYTGISDAHLKKYMEDSTALWQDQCDGLPYTTIGSAVGTHAGPGAIAVAFFKK